MSLSLVIIAPIAYVPALNAYMEVLGKGPSNINTNVRFSSTGLEPATHLGCHTYDNDLCSKLGTRAPVPEADWLGYAIDEPENLQEALLAFEMLQSSENSSPTANVTALANELGLIKITPTIEV
jgi:hypothetical protein